MVRGRVSERWNGGNELEFKPTKMELLEELAAKAETVTLEIPLDKVEEEIIEELEKLLSDNQGKTTLRFNLVDPESDLRVQMFSRNRSVSLTPELKCYLEKHAVINFSIN